MEGEAGGLGFVSPNYGDLFRKIEGALADMDPVELKPAAKLVRASAEELATEHYPMGCLYIKIRMPGEKHAVDDVARSDYMKWAIGEALVRGLSKVGRARGARFDSILMCTEQVEIIDVQMPYMGDNLWQFCEFRFDYKLRMKNAEDAASAVQNVFVRMVEFEREFCRELEIRFRSVYRLTVLGLANKRYILMQGQDISDQIAVFKAAQENRLEDISALIKKGVDLNAYQRPARFPAGLLDEDAHFLLVTLGRTPLLAAAEEGHLEAVRLLLDGKADINFQDNSGFHALYLAAGAPEAAEKAVSLLLAWGANVNLANGSGYTALHNACGSGEAGGIRALVEGKADLSAKSKTGAAPVHVAVINDQPKSLEVLKELKANLDLPAFGGNTPVHEGVMQNNPDIIAKLLELNADINIESGPEHGYATPLKMATDRKKKKAAKKLKELGALEKIEHWCEEPSDSEFAPTGDGEYVPKVRGRLA